MCPVDADCNCMTKTLTAIDQPVIDQPIFLTRAQLGERWICSASFLKILENKGKIHPIKLGQKSPRYPMAEILEIEASGILGK